MGSTEGVSRQVRQPFTSDWYVWTFQESPVKIRISLDTIARLRRCLASATEKGIEPAGLLLGEVQASGVDITGFDEFQTAGRLDLESIDKERLKQAIQRPRSGGAEPLVVGYFRGTRDEDIRLRLEEIELIHGYLRHPKNVFLVMRQDNHEQATAGFFFWDAGTIFDEASFMPFPLDERQLAVPRPLAPVLNAAAPSAQSEARTVAKTVDEEVGAVNSIARKPRYWSRWVLISLSIVAALWSCLVTYVMLKGPVPSPVATLPAFPPPRQMISSPTYLSASRTDKNVAISWDSGLPAVAEARIGILTIKDLDTQAEYALTRPQLQMNKLIYTPKSDRLEIILEVFSSLGKSTRESIMFAAPEQSSRSRTGLDSGLPRQTQSEPLAYTQPRKESLTFPFNGLSPVTERPSVERARANLKENGFEPATLNASRPTPVVQQAASLKESRVEPTTSDVSQPQPAVQHIRMTDTPLPTQVAVSDPTKLKAPDFLAPSLASAPKIPQRPAEDVASLPVQPPTAIRQVRPVVPSSVSELIKRTVEVQVRLSIDVHGTVVAAEPILSPPGGVNQYLATAAANAARLWTFAPARRGEVPLPGEMILKFTFGPGK